MIKSFIVAVLSILGLMLVWLVIQNKWRNTFQQFITDQDVLAERRSCQNCGCTKQCENKLLPENK